MLLVMGDFNTKVGIKEPSAMSSAVVLYGLEETSEAGEQLEDLCLEHELVLACWNNIQGGCIPGPVLKATPGIR